MTLTLRMVSAGFATLAILASIILLGNQRQAYASSLLPLGFGSTIVCTVYSDLDTIGSPVNLFPDQCHNAPTAKPQCSDGIDNDGDGLIDSADPGCHTDGNASNAASYDASRNSEYSAPPPPPPALACSNGIDDDGDGLIDAADPGCHSDFNANNPESYTPNGNDESAHAPPPPPPSAENTLALCSDGIDNDADGLVDLADPDCAAFKPSITVKKIVVNTGGGAAEPSNFSMHATSPGVSESFPGSAAGTTVLLSVGAFTVSESGGPSGYGMATSTGCAGFLGVGSSTTCTVTNTFSVATTTGTTTPSTGSTDSPPADQGHTATSTDNASNTTGTGGNNNTNGGGSNTGDNSTGQTQTNGGGGSTGGGGNSSGGGGGGGNGPIVTSSATTSGNKGTVLGAATSTPMTVYKPVEACDTYLTSFIRSGAVNDPEQVRRLQYVLRDFEAAKIAVNGVYDAPTLAAVHAFQTKYAGDILTPWGITQSTGYTYLTTRKKVNEIYCRSTKQFPLTTAEQQTIEKARDASAAPASVAKPVAVVKAPSAGKASVSAGSAQPANAAQVTPQGPKSLWQRMIELIKGVGNR